MKTYPRAVGCIVLQFVVQFVLIVLIRLDYKLVLLGRSSLALRRRLFFVLPRVYCSASSLILASLFPAAFEVFVVSLRILHASYAFLKLFVLFAFITASGSSFHAINGDICGIVCIWTDKHGGGKLSSEAGFKDTLYAANYSTDPQRPIQSKAEEPHEATYN